MSTSLLVVILAGTIASIAVALWFAGRGISKYLARRNPGSVGLARVTRTGLLLYGCLVAAFCFGMAVRALAPDSTLGTYLNTELGLVVYFAGCVGILSAIEVAVKRAGRPLTTQTKDRDV